VLVAAMAGFMSLLVMNATLGGVIREYQTLERRGLQTRGWVTGKDPDQHESVHYAFRAGGGVYEGVGRAGFGNPRFHRLSIGDSVLLTYLPEDPGVSQLGDIHQLAGEEAGQFQGARIVAALAIFVIAFRSQGRRSRSVADAGGTPA
jgi:hypothetical protein